jgi:hypothetical protein
MAPNNRGASENQDTDLTWFAGRITLSFTDQRIGKSTSNPPIPQLIRKYQIPQVNTPAGSPK